MSGSLYIHIPFCIRKCPYCSFDSGAGYEGLYDRYCQAVQQELTQRSAQFSGSGLSTLFIGGGTPTVLGAPRLADLIASCRKGFGFAPDIEVTVEANPGTADFAELCQLRRAGCNRLSLGLQSCNDDELRLLGRIHNAAEGLLAFHSARKAGFESVSVDLMYGLPGQTLSAWQRTLECVLDLQPEHLSLYQLTVEPGTVYADMLARGELSLPAEKIVLAMDALNARLIGAAGYEQYEISNYCRPGCACRHNLVYWRNEEYLACGAGAVFFVEGTRGRLEADPESYCRKIEQGRSALVESERLAPAASFRESVVMGLRLIEGVDEERLQQRYHLSFAEVYGRRLLSLVEQGLLLRSGSRLRLTPRGRRLANSVMCELV